MLELNAEGLEAFVRIMRMILILNPVLHIYSSQRSHE